MRDGCWTRPLDFDFLLVESLSLLLDFILRDDLGDFFVLDLEFVCPTLLYLEFLDVSLKMRAS